MPRFQKDDIAVVLSIVSLLACGALWVDGKSEQPASKTTTSGLNISIRYDTGGTWDAGVSVSKKNGGLFRTRRLKGNELMFCKSRAHIAFNGKTPQIGSSGLITTYFSRTPGDFKSVNEIRRPNLILSRSVQEKRLVRTLYMSTTYRQPTL